MTEQVWPGSAEDRHPWVITGVAGFIGSHLLRALLAAGRTVVGVDDFSTGSRTNIADALAEATPRQRAAFRLIEGDVRSATVCRDAVEGATVVLHQAALNSVPRSLETPDRVLSANIVGATAMFAAAADAGVRRVVYASSSSVYGDIPVALRQEDVLGRPLSPYAVSKHATEQLAAVYERLSGIPMIGLRYFNVFGTRQNYESRYAAVIPRWTRALLSGSDLTVYGDGLQTRDFTHVDNVVAANVLAATRTCEHRVFNVGSGHGTSVYELFALLRGHVAALPGHRAASRVEPVAAAPRSGDVRDAYADLTRVVDDIGYRPVTGLDDGLRRTVSWFAERTLAAADPASGGGPRLPLGGPTPGT